MFQLFEPFRSQHTASLRSAFGFKRQTKVLTLLDSEVHETANMCVQPVQPLNSLQLIKLTSQS